MSLKVKAPWAMPAETAAVGKAILGEESAYRLIGEKLFDKFQEQDFIELYSVEGKPAISPVILAFVTVFQFMEKLPDRQAAESLRMRMDWKYALHLPLAHEGFDYSVLSEFRDRLVEHDAEGLVFERLVQEFRSMGLIKQRGRQRTDSIAMLMSVRRLSRLELVVETLRLAVGAALKVDREWVEGLIPPSWEDRYGERFVLQRHRKEEWAEHDQNVGEDGRWFIERVEGDGAPAEIRSLPEVQVLKTVWAQQFQETEGKIVYQAGITYDGHTQIQTPHDPQARYSRKRVQEWVGGKVQVTETDDEDYPHIITDIAGTCSSKTDYESLTEIQQRLVARQCSPEKQYVDSAYISGPNLATSTENGINLIGPACPVVSKQSKLPNGITTDQFAIDFEKHTATCPAGTSAQADYGWKGKIRFHFPAEVCATCSLRERCCTGTKGRTLCVGLTYPLLQEARKRQKTQEFKEDYHKHRSGVEGCLSALARGNGMRISRYTNNKKRHLQAVFSGSAANLKRAANWLAGLRPKRSHCPWNLNPQPSTIS
jgi:transposase